MKCVELSFNTMKFAFMVTLPYIYDRSHRHGGLVQIAEREVVSNGRVHLALIMFFKISPRTEVFFFQQKKKRTNLSIFLTALLL